MSRFAMFVRWCVLLVLPLLLGHAQLIAHGQEAKPKPAVAYLCSGLTGGSIMAPKWRFEGDGMAQQSVRVVFAGDGERASVKSSIGSKTYYEADGVGVSMSAGFAVLVVAQDRLETYTYSAGTMELLFSATRMGNQLLPNSIKAFRGTCVPDGGR